MSTPHSRNTWPGFDQRINNPTYIDTATYFDLAADRVRKIDELIKQSRPTSILDIGYFPGLIGRRIKEMHPDIHLVGIGKSNGAAAKAVGYDEIHDAEFDPFYGVVSIPRIDRKFDLILGCEIIEHLIQPKPFLSFIADSLSDNGSTLITTPNVSSFGAIGRLLKGKSNYEALKHSVIMLNNDWRAHVRLYDRSELIELGRMFGLHCTEHRYYRNSAMDHEKAKGATWLLRSTFSAIPTYREDQYAVFQRA